MATEGLIFPAFCSDFGIDVFQRLCRTDAYVCIWVFRLFRFLPLLLLLGHENPDLLDRQTLLDRSIQVMQPGAERFPLIDRFTRKQHFPGKPAENNHEQNRH